MDLDRLDPILGRMDALLVSLAPNLSAAARAAADRWRADGQALRFHLRTVRGRERERSGRPLLLAVIGGTGTGKSTLVNRLLGADVTAASFRRTFTAGPVALCRNPKDIPDGWLGAGVEFSVASAADLPARGRQGTLVIVPGGDWELLRDVTLIDTPDLDGDTPSHHAQAERAFRWAEAVIFLVTPEKYQMTELWPYYRLARRYAVPALYVMNKCEEREVFEDYQRLLTAQAAETQTMEMLAAAPTLPTFVIPRDDSMYQAPPEANLTALKTTIRAIPQPDAAARERGLGMRAADLAGRFNDQVLAPVRVDRREADKLIAAVRAMSAPQGAVVDVNPLTQQLQRRLQQRSILYLIGPGRVLDRVRQAPGLIVRLPRVAWDYLKTGQVAAGAFSPGEATKADEPPDFRAVLTDQFAVLHSRIDDVVRSTPAGERWLKEAAASYAEARLDPGDAGKIVEEELADLRAWMEQRWNATPRDRRAVETLLKYLPGGRKLADASEAAPYLLTVVLCATGSTMLGGLDWLLLGGYSLATWVTERLTNEVTARARRTNTRIEERFAALAQDQIERVANWLDRQAPPARAMEQLERLADEAAEAAGG